MAVPQLFKLRFGAAEPSQVIELRETVLAAGHPGRPTIWPYDRLVETAHYALFDDKIAVACVSLTPATFPLGDSRSRGHYRFHSMAVDSALQGKGLGRQIFDQLCTQLPIDAELLWGTARPSAVPFYQRLGLRLHPEPHVVPETSFLARYVILDRATWTTSRV